MSEFIKFPSIDNHYEQGSTARWTKRFPDLALANFIITEKLDGSNFQVIITADDITCCTRKRTLTIADSFFDYQRTILVNRKTELVKLQKYVQDTEDVENVYVYGEIFGEGVQKRIHYMKGKDFLPFEVRINEKLISIKAAFDLFTSVGIDYNKFWVPVVGVADSLDKALECNVTEVVTAVEGGHIDAELNRNIEGVVIAPFDKVYAFDNFQADEDGNKIFMGESVFRLKKKCKEFNDKMKVKTKELVVFEGSDEYNRLRNIWDGYFNENRLADLFSKEGPIETRKEIGKYIKLLGEDVKEDFLKEHKDAFILLTDIEKKKIMSSAGQNTLPLLQAAL
jgi:Rnl2 family RNA ligase